MILSAVCSGMDIHQASAQMSGLVNFNCLFLCGIPGLQGPAGVQGNQGPAGQNGLNGLQGPAGAQGPQGDIGATGPQGSPGVNGTNGIQGPPGTPCPHQSTLSEPTYQTNGEGFNRVVPPSFINSNDSVIPDHPSIPGNYSVCIP